MDLIRSWMFVPGHRQRMIDKAFGLKTDAIMLDIEDGVAPNEKDTARKNIAESLGLPKDRGEIVRSVQPGTPAAKAGLQQGDVIVRVNGRDVNPDQTVSYLVANSSVGARVPLEIIRGGRRQTVNVQVGQRPTEEELAKQLGGDDDQGLNPEQSPATPGSTALGLSLQQLTPQIARIGERLDAEPVGQTARRAVVTIDHRDQAGAGAGRVFLGVMAAEMAAADDGGADQPHAGAGSIAASALCSIRPTSSAMTSASA